MLGGSMQDLVTLGEGGHEFIERPEVFDKMWPGVKTCTKKFGEHTHAHTHTHTHTSQHDSRK